MSIEWETVDNPTYTAETATINGHVVSVCLNDEGPMRPAYYWDIDNRAVDGWASTVANARRDAIAHAKTMRHPDTVANDPAVHPNYWALTHPEGCRTCRVCPDCFRPRRPDQFGTDGLCHRCTV